MNEKVRIIALGNRAACTYRKNPSAPAGLPLDKLEIWAKDVCLLDIAAIPAVGEKMLDGNGEVAYVVTEAHRAAMLQTLIERPILAAVLEGQKLCTTIRVSPASTLIQAVGECLRVWRGDGGMGLAHGVGTPAWIAGTDPILVEALAQEMGITEVREYEGEDA